MNNDCRARNASSDDTDAIVALINLQAHRYCGENRIGSDEVQAWFLEPGVPQNDTQSWWSKDGTLIAYAQVYAPEFPSAWDMLHDVTVHPDMASDAGLWDDVFKWCEKFQWNARRNKTDEPTNRLCCGARVYENDFLKREQYESRGFGHVRNETLMRVELEEAVSRKTVRPEGVTFRRLDLETDLEGYALAYSEAFQDHWGFASLTLDEWIRRKRSEFASWGTMYVPELWFVALEDDTIVGSVGSFLNYANDQGRNYLYHVFVRRAWRNRKIATALLLNAFQALYERGGKTVELHVDSDNLTYGIELYEGVGMRPVWHQRLYERTYEAADSGY